MSEALKQNIPPELFLSAKKWEQLHGEKYELWRKSRWIDSSNVTQVFLNHLFPLGRLEGNGNEKRLLPHQAEAVQRAIYSAEILDLDPLLLTLATGTGKTLVMASIITWLACKNEINTYIVFCPNTIVRDRLKKDFESLDVFKEFNLFPPEYHSRLNQLRCSVVEGRQTNFSNIFGFNLLVANRHQFQIGYDSGKDHLKFVEDNSGKLAIFNDEAHNTRGREYDRTLKLMSKKSLFRMDVTATPDRADDLRPKSHEIYNLSVVQAITGSYRFNQYIEKNYSNYPLLVKDVAVQRPSIKTLGAIQLSDLTNINDLIFKDNKTGQELKVREINWEELPRQKNLQLVMDPACMKMQLHLSVEALNRKIEIAKGRYKPLLFVIAPSIIGAQQAQDMMKKEFKLNPLLVVDDDSKYEKLELREAASNLGNSEYDSVVSVYMLREGWDVPEVSVICLLRGFGSPLFAHQVLGRGLRLIRKNGLATDRNVQELTVIDHPALMLDDLWAEIDALVREGDEIVRDPEIPRGTENEGDYNDDEKDKPPEQVIVRQELYDLLFPIPSPKSVDLISTERALELLEVSLNCLRDYKPEDLVFVKVEIDGVTRYRPQKKEQRIDESITVTALPQTNEDRDFAQKRLNEMIMNWTEYLCDRYEPFITYQDSVYKLILKYIEKILCGDRLITEVNTATLYAIMHSIPQIRESVVYELNHRIYSEEILQDG